jgi:hypothetical protein
MAKVHRRLNAELAQEDVLLNDPTSYAGSWRGWFRSCWRRGPRRGEAACTRYGHAKQGRPYRAQARTVRSPPGAFADIVRYASADPGPRSRSAPSPQPRCSEGAERGDRNLVTLAANRITLGLPCEATRCLGTIPRTAAEGESNPIGELGKRTYASRVGCFPSERSRVNSSATVGIEPAGISWYSVDINPHTYAANPHT